ncbi:MAG: hypothetical protein GEU78_14480 [Actinobacteria bacterium]|nr:hypothetical protein [Actinomycetota bacterium]
MSTLRFGRLLLDSGDVWVTSPSYSDTVKLTAVASARSAVQEDTLLVRRQLMGHRGHVVPVVWSADPSWQGWYEVEDVSVAGARGFSTFGAPVLQITASLRRVVDGAADAESLLVGANLANDHDISGVRWHAPAAGSNGYLSRPAPTAFVDRTGETGPVRVWAGMDARSALWSTPPGDWCAGAAAIDQNGRTVTGFETDDTPGDWEMANTLLRIRPDGSAFEVATWHDGAWRPKVWDVLVDGTVPIWSGLAVLRNTPEACAVRLTALQNPGRVALDLTLRRGARTVTGFLSSDQFVDLTVQLGTAEAGEITDGGVKADVADTDGLTYVAATPHGHTVDLVQGGITRASATSLAFTVGASVSTADHETAEALVAQFVGYLDERVRVVRR